LANISIKYLLLINTVISDKDIIKTCLLDLDKNKSKLELFTPSVQDGVTVLDQVSALNYIKTFTKRNTLSDVMQILSDYFLPHVGELNFTSRRGRQHQ